MYSLKMQTQLRPLPSFCFCRLWPLTLHFNSALQPRLRSPRPGVPGVEVISKRRKPLPTSLQGRVPQLQLLQLSETCIRPSSRSDGNTAEREFIGFCGKLRGVWVSELTGSTYLSNPLSPLLPFPLSPQPPSFPL